MICENHVKIIKKKIFPYIFSLVSYILISFNYDTSNVFIPKVKSLFLFCDDARKIRFFIVRIHPRNNRSLNYRAWLTPFTFHSRRKPRVSFVENNRAVLAHKCISRFDGDSIGMIQCFSFDFRKRL